MIERAQAEPGPHDDVECPARNIINLFQAAPQTCPFIACCQTYAYALAATSFFSSGVKGGIGRLENIRSRMKTCFRDRSNGACWSSVSLSHLGRPSRQIFGLINQSLAVTQEAAEHPLLCQEDRAVSAMPQRIPIAWLRTAAVSATVHPTTGPSPHRWRRAWPPAPGLGAASRRLVQR